MSACFEPLKKMNVGLRAPMSRQENLVGSSGSHCSNLVFGRNSLRGVDITLQKVDVGVLLGERLEHWGNLVAWPAPKPLGGNNEVLFAHRVG